MIRRPIIDIRLAAEGGRPAPPPYRPLCHGQGGDLRQRARGRHAREALPSTT